MLYLVLCSFGTAVGKYFLELEQRYISRHQCSESFALMAEDVAGIQALGEVLL